METPVKMTDRDIIMKLMARPRLYEKGSAVMWTDPYISNRLLELHLDPDHDIASRSRQKIEHTVQWIQAQARKERMKVLDLGCGPGFYAEYMTLLGHEVTGVDFSVNTVRYATDQARDKKLNITYLNQNYLHLDFKEYFDLVILIYLDFCVLLPEERDQVLTNIHRALKPGGLFICDVLNEKIPDDKVAPRSWEAQEAGFWKATPYLALKEDFHFPEAKVTATRHTILDHHCNADTYIFWTHNYSREDMTEVLSVKGFSDIKNFENVLPDSADSWNSQNITFYLAEKKKL